MKALTVIALLVNSIAARKYLMDGPTEVKSPAHVQIEACPEICIFKDPGLNQWCFKGTNPHFLMGWQFLQTYAKTDDKPQVNYYALRFALYA